MPEPTSGPAPPDLVPARMLNEWVVCPRLACLEWVLGEFADPADTIEGRALHRRVDALTRLGDRSILGEGGETG